MVIPYFVPPALELGPLSIQAFGVLVAIGVLVGAAVCTRESEKRGLDPQILADFAMWGVVVGVVVGHWVHLFAYHPEELSKSPFQIFKVWDGLSSMGGLLGGILAAAVYFRVKGASFRAYADPLALAVSLAWGIARIGCFFAHDHPGARTDFFLAVDFPGGPRHDLGLYDAVALLTMYLVLKALANKGLMKHRLLPLLALMYGTTRFFFDFLRASDMNYVDARYFGLTPAQYACMGLWAYGIYELWRYKQKGPPPLPSTAPAKSVAAGRSKARKRA